MKIKDFSEKIEIPSGVEVKVDDGVVNVSHNGKNITKNLKNKQVVVGVEENNVVIKIKKGTKKEKTIAGTFKAHVKNMLNGVLKNCVYKLKICSGHFPMNVAASGNKFIISNFLGEKTPREMHIKSGVEVKIEGDIITVEGPDKELASQVAADIEMLTRVRGRDLRIFQDGIYIINKNGEEVA